MFVFLYLCRMGSFTWRAGTHWARFVPRFRAALRFSWDATGATSGSGCEACARRLPPPFPHTRRFPGPSPRAVKAPPSATPRLDGAWVGPYAFWRGSGGGLETIPRAEAGGRRRVPPCRRPVAGAHADATKWIRGCGRTTRSERGDGLLAPRGRWCGAQSSSVRTEGRKRVHVRPSLSHDESNPEAHPLSEYQSPGPDLRQDAGGRATWPGRR